MIQRMPRTAEAWTIWFISTYDSEVTEFGGGMNIKIWEEKYQHCEAQT